MNGAILITGASGFLGTQVARLLLDQTEQPIIVLVRSNNLASAKLRLERSWWDWPVLINAIGKRIEVLYADLSKPQLGLNDSDYKKLTLSVSHIVHLAADIRLNEPLNVLRLANVQSTENLLEFAYAVQRLNNLIRFSYVSTAYVAGKRTGIVSEEALTGQYGFANNYELSKFEAESLIQAAKTDLPISVFRPGMVVGDSRSGVIKTFNTLYFPLRLYLTGKLKFFPVNPNMKINLIPGDYVAEAIVKLTFDPRAEGLNFHLTLPADSLPTVSELIHFTRKWALKKLRVQLPIPVFIPVQVWIYRWLRFFSIAKSPLRSLLTLASYFEENRIYQRKNLDRLLGTTQADWRSFLPQMLEYAVHKGFMHRSERTVHEQAIFRMARKSRPIHYYDLISGKAVLCSAGEIKHQVEMAVSSLAKMGIGPGDRVAVVGFNSTRYLIIDIAVGLIGGVSVPLYYSSPAHEIIEIINDSGAKIIFVGAPAIIQQLTAVDVNLNIPLVSFCRQTPNCCSENHLDWRQFLAEGKGFTAPPTAPVNFDTPATLRYTSGTTGRPKGAVFTHGQLRWMAESLASLPPWRARTRKIFYLSFLPMNHVVEGILAGYALYYAPASFDIFYLEDFHELQKMAPKIRPTVFFSVPRFYEKVWEKVAQSLIGRIYLKSKNGFCKQLLGIILRQAVNKAAGIGRCSQLIVGSAPASTGLLQAFRSIGIEIHNAYGLTEAPLITLNRFQANIIDSVGQPLPETKIRIADDGEILVKGPQVMQGYFRKTNEFSLNESSLVDGWLHTGDFGLLTKDNYLIIQGRKKELIIDAYGKNINPVKVELALSDNTGINQIMVYGNNRPYCIALFWANGSYTQADINVIETGVKQANLQLSRPEQVKRWAVLADTLSIADGDLTANLKMKRVALAIKYTKIIEALYKQDKIDFKENKSVTFGQID